jgi:branched-chain amino acid transport system substrate-binding protein
MTTNRWSRHWRAFAGCGSAALAALGVAIATTGAASAHKTASIASSAAAPSSYVQYTGGAAKAANPKLSPVEIGFVNDQGGSTVIAGTDPTTGFEAGVKWVNEYADGIDGHPLKVVTCFVKNAEAEGQTCAQQFLANKNIDVIAYGAMALGATTIDSTVAGRKPIVEGVSINPPDLTTKHDYVFFGAVPYIDYPWATFAKETLHAKTAALLYPNQTGQLEVEQAALKSMKAAGIKAKLVGFDPNSTDLTGALEAAGATTADFVETNAATPSQCLAFANSATQLGINPHKILGLFQCQVPSIKSQYPGGDYPKWNYSVADAGVEYENGPAEKTLQAVFKGVGLVVGDPWTLVEYSSALTIAKLMNKAGYAKLSPAAFEAQAAKFHGPVLLGPSKLSCGKYPKNPAVCADGDAFFKYDGNGKFTLENAWLETPASLQKALGAK